MIKNELEYRITKTAMGKFQNTLSKINEATNGLEPWAKEAYRVRKVAATLRVGRRKIKTAST